MAQTAMREPVYAVSVTRDLNQLDKLALDIERVTRQFQIVKQPEIQDLATNYFSQYQVKLEALCKTTDANELCLDNQAQIENLAAVYTDSDAELKQGLAKLRLSLNRLNQATKNQLDERLQQQNTAIERVQRQQLWVSFILIAISGALALFSSAKILAPVRKLEVLIKELADKQHKLSPISRQGPQELIVLEHKLHRLAKRLNQLENLRKAMLRHAAHELKTPLASLKEGCSLLFDEVLGPLTQQQVEVVVLLNTSANRLEKLISQLLDYNMLLQQTTPNIEQIKSDGFIQNFINDHQLALQQHDHQIDIDNQLSILVADDILLRRIFDNLLSNAIAYGSSNKPITIKLTANNRQQIIRFSNAGATVNPEDSETLFKPFQRGSSARNDRITGSGLGLSIVYECTALMGGSVGFIDNGQDDVCVEVILPLSAPTQITNQEVSL